MRVGEYVLVTKKDSDLYRRRCRIIEITNGDSYKVYSEGLEQDEILPASDLQPSNW